MSQKSRLTTSPLLLLLLFPCTGGFVLKSTELLVRSDDNSLFVAASDDGMEELARLEDLRRDLEPLFKPQQLAATLPTTVGKRRRQALELQLLESLADSDEAVDVLMDLWIHECPGEHKAIRAIQRLETKLDENDVQVLQRVCESQMNDDTTPVQWVEPFLRLAMYYAAVGHYSQSDEYIQIVLSHKPWHFEALYLQLCVSLRTDSANLYASARSCLPPLSRPNHRRQWVDRQVQIASAKYLPQQQQQQPPMAWQ